MLITLVLECVDYLLTYIFLPLNIRLLVTILTQTITLQDLAISTSRRLYIYFLFKPPEILMLSHSRAGRCLFTGAVSDD